ncbi:MAG: 3-deoxy-manno-octulosonate cytidylyltransferase [Desulfobacteraceae bacterium]|jgi:3-deoxy-manno-octulosonate cytidylyltransferase (CMP-KDO synthetase)
MKIVAIIPSRYGSTRFDGKPLAPIAGKPMIQHVYEAASKAERIHQVVVATDDRRIFDAVEGFGGRVALTSESQRSGTDRVAEAAQILGMALEDIVINVQGDQPLMDPRCLDEVVAPFNSDPQLGMSTLAFRIVDPQEYTNPKDVKVVLNRNGDALYFSRAPIPFARDDDEAFDSYKHLGVYAYTRRFLEIFRELPTGSLERIEKLEQLRALEFGYRVKVVITGYDSPEVDLPADIARIEALIK